MSEFATRWLVISVISLLTFCGASAAPPDARLEEARRLQQQTVDAYERGNHQEGIAMAVLRHTLKGPRASGIAG
jgi:hypothetical protein